MIRLGKQGSALPDSTNYGSALVSIFSSSKGLNIFIPLTLSSLIYLGL